MIDKSNKHSNILEVCKHLAFVVGEHNFNDIKLYLGLANDVCGFGRLVFLESLGITNYLNTQFYRIINMKY